VLVKLSSRCRTESINSLTLFSAAATCPCRNTLVFPIWTARRSVGVGDLVFVGASDVPDEGAVFAGGAGVVASNSSYMGFLD